MLFSSVPASAATLEDAQTAYREGKFSLAADMAREIGTPLALSLAARAGIAHATLEVPVVDRMPILRQAEKDARAAVAADENFADAQLQLAAVLGQIGRLRSPFSAQFSGIAEETRIRIKRALSIEPNNPAALAADGAWNLEVSRRTGRGLGSLLFEASRAQGLKAFETAIRADPDNVALRLQFALALLSYDDRAFRSTAEETLKIAARLQPRDAFGLIMKKRANRLAHLIDEDDKKTLEATIDAYKGMTDEPIQPQTALRNSDLIGLPR